MAVSHEKIYKQVATKVAEKLRQAGRNSKQARINPDKHAGKKEASWKKGKEERLWINKKTNKDIKLKTTV